MILIPITYTANTMMLPSPTPPKFTPKRVTIMSPASAVRAMAVAPESACLAAARDSIPPLDFVSRSATARMMRFARLLPIRSPTARSSKPRSAALTSTLNSGSEVAPARSTLPITNRPKPVRSAMRSAARARNVPATITTAAETANSRTANAKAAPSFCPGHKIMMRSHERN